MTNMQISPSPPPGQDVIPALKRASKATGVNFNFLVEQARTESGLNPQAQAQTSSARGLFQFIDSTWLEVIDKHGAKHGLEVAALGIERDASGLPVVSDAARLVEILELRDDPYISGVMAGELAKDNSVKLAQQLGRTARPAELYMAHFLGAGGAAAFLGGLQKNPDIEASYIVPAAARANHSVFYRDGRALSLHQVYASFEGKFSGSAEVASGIPENGTATSSEVARFATKVAMVPIKAATVAALSDSYPGAEKLGQITEDPGFINVNSPQSATSASLVNHVAFSGDRISLQQSPSQATLFALQLMQSMSLPEAEDEPAKRTWRA